MLTSFLQIRQKLKIKDLFAKLKTLGKTHIPFLKTICSFLHENLFMAKNDFFVSSFLSKICQKLKTYLQNYRPWETIAHTIFKDYIWLFIWELSVTIYLCQFFFVTSFLKEKTSKINNQRLFCKTTDLRKYAHIILKGHFWLFIGGFFKSKFLGKKLNFQCDVIFEQNFKNQRLICYRNCKRCSYHFSRSTLTLCRRIVRNKFF